MKKQLLLGSALLAAISAFPQQAVPKGVGQGDVGAILAKKFEMKMNPGEPSKTTQTQATIKPEYGPEVDPKSTEKSAGAKITAPSQWKRVSASMNIYGSIVSNSKVLMYNDELNTVSFIHRKSPTYVPNPMPSDGGAQAGAIVGSFTDDWGNNWDSTLIWNDETYWGRYPQGGIYSIPGNKCLFDSAYIIATGPVTPLAGGWVGSFMASKQLDTLGGAGNNDTVSSNLSAHLYVSNSGSLPFGKWDFPRYDFAVTDDGAVRTLGILANNVNGTGAAYGFKGASVVKGTFVSGAFTWDADSIQPKVFINSAGNQQVSGVPHMAWNESGTVGYVWFIGVRDTSDIPDSMAHGSNFSFQPIVFKTTNSGATWTELPRINFNTETGAFNEMFRRMFAIRNDSFAVPYFNVGEEVDAIVDRNDRLHIVATIFSSSTNHPDSLNYVYTFNNADGERYWYRHTAGARPYIYDFTETGNGWKVTLIDSMSTEAPGTATGTDGYGDNPWDPNGGGDNTTKVDVNARIQLSRTPDGKYIVYTFAESDTGLTNLYHKWNSIPNIKARLAEVGPEVGGVASLNVHPLEINITNPASTSVPPYVQNNAVQNRAYMHYVSPKCAVISNPAALPNVAIGLPITITNSNPLAQYATNVHHYLSANLNFGNVSNVDWPVNECIAPKDTTGGGDTTDTTDIAERVKSILNSQLFPNPASGSAQLSITLEQGADVTVAVLNTIGQVVSTSRHKANAGGNVINLNVADLANGVYMVNIKVGDATGTKRLLIQH